MKKTTLNDLFAPYASGWTLTAEKVEATNQYLAQSGSDKKFSPEKLEYYQVRTVKELENTTLKIPFFAQRGLESFLATMKANDVQELMASPSKSRWAVINDHTDHSITLINPNKEFEFNLPQKNKRRIQAISSEKER